MGEIAGVARQKETEAEVAREFVLRGGIKPGYDVFIIIVTTLSILNWVLLVTPFSDPRDIRGLLLFMEPIFTVILLGDFGFRLRLAGKGHRWEYMNRHGGWLDLLGSLPYGRVLRLFRLVRVLQGFRDFGFRRTIKWFVAHRAQGTFFLVLGFLIVVLEAGGLLVLWFEAGAKGSNIETGGEALWWGVVTITTVGYGDYYPVTPGGQVVATIMIFSGVSLIAIFTAWVASTFLSPSSEASSAQPADPSGGAPGSSSSGDAPSSADATRDAADPSAIIADLRMRLDQLEALVGKGSGSS